jgi:solute carrier family 36 (proton-coupled amino acid transporter)
MELQKQCNVYVNESFDASGEKFGDSENENKIRGKNVVVNEKKSAHGIESADGSISYTETLMHLFKGNVGSGCFAMADAVKNCGLILAPILTLFLGVFCVHAQHMLLKCSQKMKAKNQLTAKPDYAETVELCFASSNNKKWQKLAPTMKAICNIFICVTQLGFCCIYLLFVGTNLKQVLDFYGFNLNLNVLIMLVLIPIWLSSLITNLKLLGEILSLC